MSSTILFNARDLNLNQNSTQVPNMSSTLKGWLKLLTFTVITKNTINGLVTETSIDKTFCGVIQPLNTRDLMIKPEGQRAWQWYQVHSTIALALEIDNIIKYNGISYRVMAINEYSSYGYYEYHIAKDYN